MKLKITPIRISLALALSALILFLLKFVEMPQTPEEVSPLEKRAITQSVKESISSTSQKRPRTTAAGQTALKTLVNNKLGIAIEYDQILDSEATRSLIHSLDPKLADRFKYANISLYLRDGSLIFLSDINQATETYSLFPNFIHQIKENGQLFTNFTPSSFLKIENKELMLELFTTLQSRGFGHGNPDIPSSFEGYVLATSLKATDSGINSQPTNKDLLQTEEWIPAILTVQRGGIGDLSDGSKYYYNPEKTVRWSYTIEGVYKHPEASGFGPFNGYTIKEAGIFIEPLMEEVERVGVQHPTYSDRP